MRPHDRLRRLPGAALVLALAAAFTLPLVLAPTLAFAAEEPFVWAKRLAPGKRVQIRGVNGDVRAVLAPGNEVRVEAVKTAKQSDPSLVRIAFVEDEDGVLICACYPNSGEGGGSCCRDDSYGRDTKDVDVVVDFIVKLPAGVDLEASTVNGDIDAVGLRSPVQATTVNGTIEISTTKLARATTVNGSIRARMGASSWNGDLAFTTVSGRIRIELPPQVSADVTAQTLSGAIRTDFDLPVWKEHLNTRMSGTIGQGGRQLSLSTVSGSIELRAIETL
jgi:hypothetical protein